MPYENLLVEKRAPVAIVTLNRPKVLNALSAATLGELDSAIHELAADAEVRAILLTGAGEKAFVAGADINELAQADAASGKTLAETGQRIFSFIETCGTPVIACVNGFALGGGCELAMACTFRIASENAQFGQPEVKLGIICGYGGTQRLPRLVGRGRAMQLLLTGAMIPAGEALRIGLVNEVVPLDRLLARGEEIAKAIAAVAPAAVRLTIAAVHEGADTPSDKGMAIEAERFSEACATGDKNEGTAAFLAKRAPVWRGR